MNALMSLVSAALGPVLQSLLERAVVAADIQHFETVGDNQVRLLLEVTVTLPEDDAHG